MPAVGTLSHARPSNILRALLLCARAKPQRPARLGCIRRIAHSRPLRTRFVPGNLIRLCPPPPGEPSLPCPGTRVLQTSRSRSARARYPRPREPGRLATPSANRSVRGSKIDGHAPQATRARSGHAYMSMVARMFIGRSLRHSSCHHIPCHDAGRFALPPSRHLVHEYCHEHEL